MRRILFDSEPHHVFVFGDLTVNGGEEFLVADDEVAEDLLSAPYQNLRELPLDLSTLTREELNEFALRAGVKKPERLGNKDLVIEAIDALAVGPDPDAPPEGGEKPPPA